MRHTLFTVLSISLAVGCSASDDKPTPNPKRMLTQLEFLERHADLDTTPLSAKERELLAEGGVLWDRIADARTAGDDLPEAFITATGVRVMPEGLHTEYVKRINALPDQSDPVALAGLRAELGLVSEVIGDEIAYDNAILTGQPVVAAAICDEEYPTEPTPVPTPEPTPTPTPTPTPVPTPDPTEYPTATAFCRPPAEEACKVTCNLNVSATFDKEDPDWSAEVRGDAKNGVRDSKDIWRTSRKSHISSSYTCQATGCEQKVWTANVTKTNLGDGTMSATVAAMTKYPLIDGLSDGCAVTAEANASKTSLVLSHNTNDCMAASRIPDTAQSLKIRYVKHTETKFSSGTETSGSFSINYKGNITAANAKDVNFNASGNGLDNLTVDKVAVKANANNNTTAEVNAGAAFASSWRYSTVTDGSYSSGDESMSFLNQVQGPPQLTLTSACPAKTVNYKYDIEGLQARLDLSTSLIYAPGIFCRASIKAALPRPPEKPDFDCVYTVAPSTDTHSCKGKAVTAYTPQ